MFRILSWLTWLSLSSSLATSAVADLMTYVQRPDPGYQWTWASHQRRDEGEVHHLHLVSQTWKGVVWQHDIDVAVPKYSRTPGTLLLFITGGSPSAGGAAEALRIARRAQAPCAILYGIPNQPLLDGLYEDDLIAATFIRFLSTGDAEWPLLLPMTKSVVRAMDAIQAFSREHLEHAVDGFVLTGASKRGWTSWLTGAADPRVKGIVPRVFDMLNMPAQLPHQLESWGEYSEMLGSYTEPGLPRALGTAGGQQLVQMVDPYSYRAKLTAPKLIVLGTNDRYWSLDALNLYWNDLPGTKRVLYVPNAGHGLPDTGWEDSLMCFFRDVALNAPIPELAWRRAHDRNRLLFTVDGQPNPSKGALWYAYSPSRDFREAKWHMKETDRRAGRLGADVKVSPNQFTAAFIDAEYQDASGTCRFSSQIVIEPPGAK